MRRALHLLIILLLAVAIPLRAATAATMVLCGPTHERLAQNLHSDAHSGVHAHHGHAEAQHAHPHAQHYVASPAQFADGDAVEAVKHAQFKCAFCGACCAGGFGIPSSSLIVPAVEVASLAFPPLVFAFAGWHPDGLERPPHSFLV
jgi:hypothetical protein